MQKRQKKRAIKYLLVDLGGVLNCFYLNVT